VHSSRFADASDKAYQLLARGRWFSPGTPASSTTKTGRHDRAEILLKVALNTKEKTKNKQTIKNHLLFSTLSQYFKRHMNYLIYIVNVMYFIFKNDVY
jgi:hypothetical protein